ncbi:dihydrolipoamide acetyltransferase component of pyruvate dehydrogenase complex [Siminovitchia terrae]|uniref:Dihydrolipoamide acetyltransferase component of pyruvate dehydrogenase complex n=1 Tax=Siminovitchia terrae TaxID=1914933 RepID=A0ABQ4L033_SIMTE|nr:dihydrolipoamide acetyltransferase family protein [Siminovitchia terrae]GIN97304.1 dihydrolipoamide acetyltransferase component of pyruvate dehydrogenase complex [Siminovitchia terrae]
MIEVKLHDIGEGMTEGDIISYLVKAGDNVSVDQPLVEVQTEKMVAELTSPANGTVKEILVDTGKTISVGTTILTIASEQQSTDPAPAKEEAATTVAPDAPLQKSMIMERKKGDPLSNRVKAAPYTRKVARENDVDITVVEGTGRAGRITVEDVLRYVEARDNGQTTKAAAAHTEMPIVERRSTVSRPEGSFDTIPFKGRRKQIAMKMSQSLFTIPHVCHYEEIDMTELLNFRKELKAMDENISVAAFFIKTLAIALKDYPIFNAKLDEENEVIRLEKSVHMGIAADAEEGLIVPVIRDADKKSLRAIHQEMKELTQKAKENKLAVREITGSTFTISNVGPMGSIGATPIINYPETGLMAFHKTKKMPVVNEHDEIVIRSMMNVTMTFDHRVADGGTAIAFTNRFKSLIEDPKKLMLELV